MAHVLDLLRLVSNFVEAKLDVVRSGCVQGLCKSVIVLLLVLSRDDEVVCNDMQVRDIMVVALLQDLAS